MGAALNLFSTPHLYAQEPASGKSCDVKAIEQVIAEWRLEPFGDPVCTIGKNSARIVGNGGPTGFFFRKEFRDDLERVLIVSGADRRNQVNLRLRINNGKPVWHDAPEGEARIPLGAARELEVLIYADKPFAYVLTSLRTMPKQALALARSIGTTVRIYGSGKVERAPDGFRISNGDTSGGVIFSYEFDKPNRFQLSGVSEKGTATLRIGRPGRPLRYEQFRPGPFQFNFDGEGSVEFYLYSDFPFSYVLREIKLTPCNDCPTRDDFKARILRDVPELAAALQSDRFLAARLLLDWAARNGDWTEDKEIEEATYQLIDANNVQTIFYDIFEPNKGAAFCGGLSLFLNKIYHLFGFRSFVAGFGEIRGELTHLTVIVAEPDKAGDWRFYMFDPWWNATFLDAQTGRYLPIFELIGRLRATGKAGMILDERSKADRDWLMPASKSQMCEVEIGRSGENIVCRVPSFSVAAFIKSVTPNWTAIGISGTVEGLFELFQRRIFSASNSNDDGALKAFLSRVATFKIPYGYQD